MGNPHRNFETSISLCFHFPISHPETWKFTRNRGFGWETNMGNPLFLWMCWRWENHLTMDDFPAVFDYQRIPSKNMVTQDDYFLWGFLEILYMVSAYDVRKPDSERYYGNIMISDILGACRGNIALPWQYQWYQSTESVEMQHKNCHDDLVITLYSCTQIIRNHLK